MNLQISRKSIAVWSLAALTVCAVLVAPLGLSPAMAAAEGVKIGTVDMQKALQEVELGRKAKSELEASFNKKKQELQKEENEIKKLSEEFQKQSMVMNEAAKSKKQGEIQQRIMKLQENMQRSQADIQRQEQTLTEPIITKLKGVISDVAKEKGYTVILEKSQNNVLYSQDKDDLTAEVIGQFNKKNKS